MCKYGSDPLKTYLPNSDIDITLIPILQQAERDETESAASQAQHAVTTVSSLNFYHELDR